VAKLRRCLAAVQLTDATFPFELIVVENACTDGTSQYLADFPNLIGHISFKAVSVPVPNLSRAHNAGLRASSGGLIAFTDDDCYVTPSYLKDVVAAFEDPAIAAIGGRILLYDPADFPITIKTATEREFFKPYSFIPPGAIQGANMAFRRTALDEIGGFDERRGRGTRFSGGDIAAIASVLWRGKIVIYDPKPTVYHHHGRKTKEQLNELLATYCKARGAYFATFICNPKSQRVYAKEWAKQLVSSLRVFLGGLRRGKWHPPTNWLREFKAAVLFMMQR
jgi:glycosyltransferase involved in cell wall biosynthesis